MASNLSVVCLLVVTACLFRASTSIPSYRNGFTQPCLYGSPANRAVYGFYARFRSVAAYKDRRFAFTSQTVSPSPVSHMMYFNYVPLAAKFQLSPTPYGQNFEKRCRKNGKWGVLTDIVSFYHWGWKDRNFHFACRWLGQNGWRKYKLANCFWTGYINSYGGNAVYTAPYNRVIVRVRSTFSFAVRDRRFRFRICRVVRDL